MTDMTPQQVLAGAAEVIARDGWTQGNFHKTPKPDGYADAKAWHEALGEAARKAPVCALGAITRAVTGSSEPQWGFFGGERRVDLLCQQAARLLADSLGVGSGFGQQAEGVNGLGLIQQAVDGRGTIPGWNDAPERTAEDVILALKRAAHG